MFTPSALFSQALQLALGLYSDSSPTVSLGDATVIGVSNGDVSQSFLGIPFAEAPRFSAPIPIEAYEGEIHATEYGPACIQHNVTVTATSAMLGFMDNYNISIPVPHAESEDCLSINVIRPATATHDSQLPVVAHIYGGGFLIGDTETWDRMGKGLVEKSVEKGEDVIFVSFNYRLSAYGFLAGSEVKGDNAGNAGLRDQREALRWIRKYITNFGGDPSKVVLWGQSAGAISGSLQMLAYDGNTEDLFRGVFAQSGGPLPVGPIENGQYLFNDLAEMLGCDRKGADKLACLRSVPLEQLRAAVDQTDGFFSRKSLVLQWPPRADGEFLTAPPYQLVEEGKFAEVPLVTGNVDDEGTLFSLATTKDTNTQRKLMDWLQEIWMPGMTDAEKLEFHLRYPNDVTKGSPFNTGLLNAYNLQYKRTAAFQGDMVFQAPRRFFAQAAANKTNVWVYLSKQGKRTPILGSAHGSDVDVKNGRYLMTEYISRFANALDPNLGGNAAKWPVYDPSSPNPKLYLFRKANINGEFPPPKVANDDHRKKPFNFLTRLAKKYPL